MVILLYDSNRVLLASIGSLEQAEKIIGMSLEPKKVFEGRGQLVKIMDEYGVALKEAEEKGYSDDVATDGFIQFITPKKVYVRSIGIDENENAVCDSYMKSGLLKKYFDELGLTDELLANRPEFEFVPARRYNVPPTEKTVAILLYSPNNDRDHPVALFGDKALTEELIKEELTGTSLKPKKEFVGRDWLEKIMDSYRTALKEAEERKLFRREDIKGEMIFVTQKKGYVRRIGIDANTIYERHMESELLKKYFDELGLMGEINRPEFEVDFMGEAYYVPPKDKTTAILLYSPYSRNSYNYPAVLFGDKELTEKLTGIALEPEKVIEEREWLEKIRDAFVIAFENLRKEQHQKLSNFRCGEIIFITQSKGY
jgi:hypothetical protein